MKIWYTRKEATEALGYEDVKEIDKLVKNGELPAYQKKKRGRVLFDPRVIREFIKAHTFNSHLLPK